MNCQSELMILRTFVNDLMTLRVLLTNVTMDQIIC